MFPLLIGLYFLFICLTAPTPSSADTILATKCLDPGNNTDKWFYPRGAGSCRVISDDEMQSNTLANQLIFTFQVIKAFPAIKIYFHSLNQGNST
jgi:hypothetical protein